MELVRFDDDGKASLGVLRGDDHALWTPTNYGMEDSLAAWGPEVPHDFVHNHEGDPEPFAAGAEPAVAAA